jgi:mannose-6-phosphate isomerase
VQHYEWGRRGPASLVARLADRDPDPARPYAELWMGTHPSGPSTLLDAGGPLLRDWLARNPDALGPAVAARWGGDLPFLFKVSLPPRSTDACFRASCLVSRSVLLPFPPTVVVD